MTPGTDASAAGVVNLTAALVAFDTVSDRSNLPLIDLVEDRLGRSSSRWSFRRPTSLPTP